MNTNEKLIPEGIVKNNYVKVAFLDKQLMIKQLL